MWNQSRDQRKLLNYKGKIQGLTQTAFITKYRTQSSYSFLSTHGWTVILISLLDLCVTSFFGVTTIISVFHNFIHTLLCGHHQTFIQTMEIFSFSKIAVLNLIHLWITIYRWTCTLSPVSHVLVSCHTMYDWTSPPVITAGLPYFYCRHSFHWMK
jgi:hypothetical protein